MERLSYGSHRSATAENQLDPDGRLWLVVRYTANTGCMAPTACSCLASPANFIYGRVEAKALRHVTFMPVLLRPVNNFLGQATEMRQRGNTIL